jgi:hypothetical protein
MKNINHFKVVAIICILTFTICAGFSQTKWRFAVLGDTHVGVSDTLTDMIQYMLADSIDCVLVCGDIVNAGAGCDSAQFHQQLLSWIDICFPLYNSGIRVYPVRGNHENDAQNSIDIWKEVFTGSYALPQNGPFGEKNLTYSFNHKNAMFIGLDEYVNIHTINQNWLNQQLSSNTLAGIFVFGHEPAFQVYHTDCLDDSVDARNTFWQSLSLSGARVYFCGHDHFLDVAGADDGDSDSTNDVYQYVVGTGGGWLRSQYTTYGGTNIPYAPHRIYHVREHGYSLVELNSDGLNDCGITITWKIRTWDSITSSYKYVATSDIIHYHCKSSGNQNPLIKTISIYPNPVKDILTIRFSDKNRQNATIKIYNMLGHEVYCEKITKQNEEKIDLYSMPSGLYLIKTETTNFVYTNKFIKK